MRGTQWWHRDPLQHTRRGTGRGRTQWVRTMVGGWHCGWRRSSSHRNRQRNLIQTVILLALPRPARSDVRARHATSRDAERVVRLNLRRGARRAGSLRRGGGVSTSPGARPIWRRSDEEAAKLPRCGYWPANARYTARTALARAGGVRVRRVRSAGYAFNALHQPRVPDEPRGTEGCAASHAGRARVWTASGGALFAAAARSGRLRCPPASWLVQPARCCTGYGTGNRGSRPG